ncbi:MAG: translation initiation factor 1 [Paraglaciecola sp.]|jgi:translation initiation factor 1
MGKKSKKNRIGVVYSTNDNYDYDHNDSEDEIEDLAVNQQKLRVMIDRKQRGGKEVTLITGFVGSEDSLKELGKFLKQKCGVGGAAKNGEMIVQGNQRDKVVKLLKDKGYTQTKASGG